MARLTAGRREDHALCRAVLGVYAHGLLAFYARTARAHGIPEGQTGTVSPDPV